MSKPSKISKFRKNIPKTGVPLGIDDRSRASILMPFSSPIEKGIDLTDKASMSLETVPKYINSNQII